MKRIRQVNLIKVIYAGLISGVVLGLFLKLIEITTYLKVYTLLLNLDYVPILNHIHFPEIVGFLIHLMISIVLSIVLQLFLIKKDWAPKRILFFYILAGFAVGILLYPTTILSDRTPALNNNSAIGFWLLGHLLYGLTLGWLLRKPRK
ncbi:hypothetical protein [Falsibacillus albus]|uniref:DUF1440 domain-containing protein n=1 Tax=Falsibacillus albus TaxID=2478915 RepID=A0A3L7JSF9_9BACI|nr:hypothetical protein [Falsibacillus albus]RLQ93817.1 hypothetical protein D9X91_16235 [Falsibacillus albus]